MNSQKNGKNQAWSSLIALGLITGCFSPQLKPGAAGVHIFFQDADSSQCRLVSRIETGNNRIGSFQDAQIVLRNAAYDMGANAIRIQEFKPGRIAQGEALNCPAEVIRQNSYDPDQKRDTGNQETSTTTTNTANTNQNNQNTSTTTNQTNPAVNSETVAAGQQLWMRCSYGQYLANGTCQGQSQMLDWKAAVKYCNQLTAGGRSWRLPGQAELQGLLTRTKSANGVFINANEFPNTTAGLYWTAEYYNDQNPNVVWAVDFQSSNSFAYGMSNKAFSRCLAD
ncbi:MAG: DUF1566 domain-containing protein [Leptospiraceae bacterium]|nr:DUF1566 domain-containing protein [Leptospiraceae bacterium]